MNTPANDGVPEEQDHGFNKETGSMESSIPSSDKNMEELPRKNMQGDTKTGKGKSGEIPNSSSSGGLYAKIVKGNGPKPKVNFRYFTTDKIIGDESVDVLLPSESVRESSKHYTFTLYGYFLGKRIAFHVVQN